ncbi:TPA: polysaccharide biosynthesis C-terminal domain-containing protein [Streptococcus suis]
MIKLNKTINNILFGIIYQISNVLLNFIMTPIIIRTFGSGTNGLIQTIRQVINYVQFVGSGIAESAVVSLYEPIHFSNYQKVNSILNAVNKTFNKSGILFSLISIFLAAFCPLVLKSDLNYFDTFLLFIILSSVGVSEFFIIGKYRALLIADQKIYVVHIIQTLALLLSLVLMYLFSLLGFSVIIVQLGIALGYISRIILIIIYIRRHYKYLDTKVPGDNEALNKRKSATIHQLAGIVTFGSQIVIVNLFLGSQEASVYSVYSLIFTGINTILGVFSSSLLALFGNLIVSNDREKTIKVFKYYENLYYLLVFVLYSVTVIMTRSFIELYVGFSRDVNYQRTDLIVLFAIMGILNCVRTPGATIINASGHYSETQNRAVTELLICITGQLFLVHYWGINGIVVATILAYLYRSVDVIIYSNKIIFSNFIDTFITILLDASIMIVLVLCTLTNYEHSITNFQSWFLTSTIFAVIYFMIFLLLNVGFKISLYKEIYFRFLRK